MDRGRPWGLALWLVEMQPLNRGPHKGGTHLAHLKTGITAGSTAGKEPSKANMLKQGPAQS